MVDEIVLKELEVLRFGRLPDTDYAFFATTFMSKKLDKLFGLDYIKMITKYGVYTEKDLDIAHMILEVDGCPTKGLKGQIILPVPEKVQKNLISAKSFLSGSPDIERVVDLFSEQAKKVGYFFALPYDDVVRNRWNRVSDNDIARAVEEGYAQMGAFSRFDGIPVHMVELTNKFRPLGKQNLPKRTRYERNDLLSTYFSELKS